MAINLQNREQPYKMMFCLAFGRVHGIDVYYKVRGKGDKEAKHQVDYNIQLFCQQDYLTPNDVFT